MENLTTTEISPKAALKSRMDKAYKELRELAAKKTAGVNAKLVYAKIGLLFEITGQTVENYISGKSEKANGYLIDALIQEFKRLPTRKNN